MVLANASSHSNTIYSVTASAGLTKIKIETPQFSIQTSADHAVMIGKTNPKFQFSINFLFNKNFYSNPSMRKFNLAKFVKIQVEHPNLDS